MMNSSFFVDSFLYPSYTTCTDIRRVLHPFEEPSSHLSDTTSSYSTSSESEEEGDYNEPDQHLGLHREPDLPGNVGNHHELSWHVTPDPDQEERCHVTSDCPRKQDGGTVIYAKQENVLRISESTVAVSRQDIKKLEVSSLDTTSPLPDTTSPLDDMDLIDIILKDGVHKELKSLRRDKPSHHGNLPDRDIVEGSLSSVTESGEDLGSATRGNSGEDQVVGVRERGSVSPEKDLGTAPRGKCHVEGRMSREDEKESGKITGEDEICNNNLVSPPIMPKTVPTAVFIRDNNLPTLEGGMLGTIRRNALGSTCMNREREQILPTEGLSLGVYLLFSDKNNDILLNSHSFIGIFDAIEASLTKGRDLPIESGRNPIGIGFTSFILSENTPDFLLQLFKEEFLHLYPSLTMLILFDVISEHLTVECFDFQSLNPLIYNIAED